MSRKNSSKTVKLQATIDETTNRIIDEMSSLGFHGANKSEVSAWIIRSWIWSNQDQLKINGINLVTKETDNN